MASRAHTIRLPWIERFRPQSLDDIVSHDKIVRNIKLFVATHDLPHMIFAGPAGTGKTSTINAAARELYGDSYRSMVLEVNASEERGVEVVRDKITNFAYTYDVMNVPTRSKPSGDVVRFKLVILDEADSMTSDAQMMLVSLIEAASENARFCLICNEIAKIRPAIQSRCTIFKFFALKPAEITSRLNQISSQLQITITDDGMATIVRLSRGDFRKALNITQTCSMLNNVIDEEVVTTCLGYPSREMIQKLHAALTSDRISFVHVCRRVTKLMRLTGYSLRDIITELGDTLINECIVSTDPDHIRIVSQQMLKLSEIEATTSTNYSQVIGLISVFKHRYAPSQLQQFDTHTLVATK